MFLLVPAHPGCPGQIPESRKMFVVVVVVAMLVVDDVRVEQLVESVTVCMCVCVCVSTL